MTDIKKNENNKEKNSQDKKPPKSSKLLKLIKEAKTNKPQPDQVADSKKAIIGKKILEICNKKHIPESDIEIIINNIDWDKLKKSCADFYVNVTRNNPFKIYLRIIKNRIYYNSEILVKYINNIGFWKEEKLEIKHGIMHHSLGIAELYLETKKIPKSTTKGRIVKEKIMEEVERITYPKILLYLNTFTYCEVTKRINHAKKGDLGKNVKEERNLEDLKNIVEEWFSENRYNIPCDTECLSSLNLLNEADSKRPKTSKAGEDADLETGNTSFIIAGSTCEISAFNKQMSFKNLLGFIYLEQLTKQPDTEIKYSLLLELKNNQIVPDEIKQEIQEIKKDKDGKKNFGIQPDNFSMEMTTKKMIKFVMSEKDNLLEHIEELKDNNDLLIHDKNEQIGIHREKIRELDKYLSETTYHGKIKKITDTKRYKDSVTKNIKRAIEEIQKKNEDLAKHFTGNIHYKTAVILYTPSKKIF